MLRKVKDTCQKKKKGKKKKEAACQEGSSVADVLTLGLSLQMLLLSIRTTLPMTAWKMRRMMKLILLPVTGLKPVIRITEAGSLSSL